MKVIYAIIVKSFKTFSEKDAFTNAAAISYYTIFSLPALLLLILNITGSFYNEEIVKRTLIDEFAKLFGEQSANAIISTIDNLQIFDPKWWATAISILTIIFTATTVFTTLQSSLNKMFSVQANPDGNTILNYLKSRLLSFSLIGGFALILIMSLVLESVLQALGAQLQSLLGPVMASVTWVGSIVVPFILNFLIFAMLFKILPDVKIQWRNTWLAALITTTLFAIGRNGIAYYIGRTDYGGIYGTAGSILVIMVWIFYASLIILYGAVITKTIMTYKQEKIVASEFAEKI